MNPAAEDPVRRRHCCRCRRRRRSSLLALAALFSVAVVCPLAARTGWSRQSQNPPRPTQPRPGVPPGSLTTTSGTTGVPAGERPPASLEEALATVDWDPAERGTLLVVAPKMAVPKRPRPERQPDGSVRFTPMPVLKPAGDEGYRLTVIDAHFGRKLRQVGSVWAVVPETMTVLNSTRLPAPDPYMGMTREQKLRLFQSRLTGAQWKQIAGPQGLAVADLDREQRELFLSALPDPFRVQVSRTTPEGPRTESVTATRSQLNGMRISMRRQLSWAYTYDGQPNHTVMLGGGSRAGNPDGSPRLTMAYPYEDFEERRRKILDVVLAEEVPNAPKEGDVHFASGALDALIPVADAKTVGELVERVAKAARVELYADPRYASLPVHARAAGGVRAGDVLQALCLSVTGTVRKVDAGPSAGFAYVLTDEREGLAVRHARIARWLRAAGRMGERRERGVAERLEAVKPIEQVTWNPGDPMAPSAALQEKMEAHREAARKPRDPGAPFDYNNRFPMVPVTDLPPSARRMIEEQAASFQGGTVNGQPAKLRTDAVRLDVRTSTTYVIPGLGAVEAQDVFGGFGGSDSLFGSVRDQFTQRKPPKDEFALPVPVPARLADRHLFVNAKSADEARRAAREAKARGLTALWLEAGGKAEEFAERVKAAREAVPAMRVFAVARALRPGGEQVAGAETSPSATVDVNLFGEPTTATAARLEKELPEEVTDLRNPAYYDSYQISQVLKAVRGGDFPRLDLPAGRAAARARVLEIARTPGLAGLVVRDLAPPGYAAGQYGAFSEVAFGGHEIELGYTPEMRLAFLRQHGLDPIDLGVFADESVNMGGRFGGMPGSIVLPFFRNYGPSARNFTYNGVNAIGMGAKDAGEQWTRFRHRYAVEFQNDLLKALGEVRGADGKPLALVRESGLPAVSGMGFVAWDTPAAMPAAPGAPGTAAARPQPGRPEPFTGLVVISPEVLTLGSRAEERELPLADRLGLHVGRIGTSLERQAKVPNNNWRPSGMLLDLSEMPLDQALPVLGQLRPPVATLAPPSPKPKSAPTGARRAGGGGRR